MDFLDDAHKLDATVPGVTQAYRSLRASHGRGVYTSLGRYYNHTIFGRDNGMSARFVTDFDHQTAWDALLTLASYQGMKYDLITQEALGRIHHEWRDYAAWDARWFDKLTVGLAGSVWGMQNGKLLTYFAADTTATYIRLAHKYATRIDRSVLHRQVPQQDGSTVSLSESLVSAAAWIMSQVDETGVFLVKRTNRWGLFYQTFCDSVSAYAWRDKKPADVTRAHSYIEAQAYALDALHDMVHMLPGHPDVSKWRQTAKKMHSALIEQFWDDEQHTFMPGLFERAGKLQRLDTPMITSGWVLNTSFWELLPRNNHRALIVKTVKRLFREDFLTDVGLRTRSAAVDEPLGATIDYHGSQTVWPMFNFMVIEGLRRHGLYRLARQLENRILNGINAIGNFPEFMIVDREGVVHTADKRAKARLRSQMIPEQNIAFTVTPAITLAYRRTYRRHDEARSGWKYDLEMSILANIPDCQLVQPQEAAATLRPVPLRLVRLAASINSAFYIAPVIMKRQ